MITPHDYPGWLRATNDLGRADFCVVEMGANDVQSISVGQNKWVAAGTAEWQRRYTERLEEMAGTLKTQRCQEVVWLLQPAYQGNRFLNQHHTMMNSVQLSGLKSTSIQAFEIAYTENVYEHDGIHFNGPFALPSSARQWCVWPNPGAVRPPGIAPIVTLPPATKRSPLRKCPLWYSSSSTLGLLFRVVRSKLQKSYISHNRRPLAWDRTHIFWGRGSQSFYSSWNNLVKSSGLVLLS